MYFITIKNSSFDGPQTENSKIHKNRADEFALGDSEWLGE